MMTTFTHIVHKGIKRFISFLFMYLLSIIVVDSASAQKITYPNGGNCANPGDYVTIKFDRKITDFEFNKERLGSCNNSTRICRWIVIVPVFCPPDECPSGAIIEPERLSDSEIRIQVPPTTTSESYDIYYGQRTSSSFRFLIEWQTYRYTPIGELHINVCTTNPVIRTSECFCPGSEYSFDVENFFGENTSNFELSYVNSKNKNTKIAVKSSNFDSNTGKGTFTFICPTDVSESFAITLKSGKKTANATISKCLAEIKYVPSCAVKGQTINYTIANACPSSTYTIDNKTLRGSTSYNVSSIYNPSNNSQSFELKENNTVISTFDVPQCEIKVEFSQWLPPTITPTNGCQLTFDQINLRNNIFVSANGGSVQEPTLYYQYCEIIGGEPTEFKDVLSDTKFEVGKTYKFRIMIYVDNAFIRYEDTGAITISPYKVNGYTYYGGTVTVTQEGVDKNNQTVDCGSSVVFTATPNSCMKFTNWSDGNTENPRTIVVDKNWNLQANFTNSKPVIKASSENTDKGTVSIKDPWGNTLNSGSEGECNREYTITATPKDCYTFDKWSDNTTDNPKRTSNSDIDITALFKNSLVTISAAVNNAELGTATIEGNKTEIECGAPVSLTATTIGCSQFKEWRANGNKVSENATYAAAPTTNTTYEAVFEDNRPTITAPTNTSQTISKGKNIDNITFTSTSNTISCTLVSGNASGLTVTKNGNTIVISGKPTNSGTIVYNISDRERPECVVAKTATIEVIVEPLKLKCTDSGTSRFADRQGSISLPTIETGSSNCDEVNWDVKVYDKAAGGNNITAAVGLTVSGNKVNGMFPFGDSYITYTATCGEMTDTCTAKVLTIKAVDACETK